MFSFIEFESQLLVPFRFTELTWNSRKLAFKITREKKFTGKSFRNINQASKLDNFYSLSVAFKFKSLKIFTSQLKSLLRWEMAGNFTGKLWGVYVVEPMNVNWFQKSFTYLTTRKELPWLRELKVMFAVLLIYWCSWDVPQL